YTYLQERLLAPFDRRPSTEEAGPANGRSLREVQMALNGARGSIVRRNARGETIVSVAVPSQRAGTGRGALMGSTQGAPHRA
ncbi:hypothetical protein, partial [Acinetobacter baumannii]|uniref:hypothetical protein n=1 Tax=Acinetobacter baumannii TaxID=470 RepID=UPI003F686DD2